MKQVKAAEAEAEARYLSGLGVARQRKAIVQGLQESVGAFSDEVDGATPKDVMDILLLSQYFDTLSVVGANSLILEHDPATVASLRQSVGSSFLTGTAGGGGHKKKHHKKHDADWEKKCRQSSVIHPFLCIVLVVIFQLRMTWFPQALSSKQQM